MFKYCFIFFVLLGVSMSAFSAAERKGLFAYETAAGMSVGAVFGVLPSVADDDKLISAESSVCGYVEIHEMKETDGIMRMRKVPFIKVLGGKENKLEPSGFHLMLMQLKSPLKDGDKIPLVLTYQNAGQIKINALVYSRKVK